MEVVGAGILFVAWVSTLLLFLTLLPTWGLVLVVVMVADFRAGRRSGRAASLE